MEKDQQKKADIIFNINELNFLNNVLSSQVNIQGTKAAIFVISLQQKIQTLINQQTDKPNA